MIQFTQDSHEKVQKSEVRVRKVSFTSKTYYRLCSTYTQLNIVLGLYFHLSQDVALHVLRMSDVTFLFPPKLIRGSYRKSRATIVCKVTCFIIDKPKTPP